MLPEMPAEEEQLVVAADDLGRDAEHLPMLRSQPRILHLITTLDEGGTERLVLTLAQAQRRRGCAVEIAVMTRPGAAAPDFTAAGFRIHTLGLRHKVDVGAWWRLRRLLVVGDYDILHTHLDLADLYGPFALRDGRPWVVSTRHNTDDWRHRPSWKRQPFLLWERAAQRRTGATLAVSTAVKDFLVKEEGLLPDRFAVVANGIDLEPFRRLPARPQAAEALVGRLRQAGAADFAGAHASSPLMLFAGRLAPQKGVDILLAALAAGTMPGRLVICGDGPEEQSLRRQVRTLGLAEHVAFLGHQKNLAAILPAFDLFVMPSRWEGFGLAAAEAMAAGLPVVASDCDGLREVVVDGESGRLVPAGDVTALAAALHEVLADSSLAAAWGRAGRRRALEMFGSDTMAAQVLEQYRRVLAGDGVTEDDDLDTLILTDRQVRGMWRGILPPAVLRRPPGEHLQAQRRDYADVADHVETVRPMRDAIVLDLGCGLGSMLLEAGRRGADACGIEPDTDSLSLCRDRLQRVEERPAPVAAAVGESLPFADASLDIVTCCSVLEHVRDPGAVLQEVARVLKPGGLLYLGVPNALRFQERHYKVFLPPSTPRALARFYLRLRRRDPAFLDTLNEMTPGRTRYLVTGAGLEILQDPVQAGLDRLQQVHRGSHRPQRRRGRMLAGMLRLPGVAAVARLLLRRGFFVDGAVIARRPQPGPAQ